MMPRPFRQLALTALLVGLVAGGCTESESPADEGEAEEQTASEQVSGNASPDSTAQLPEPLGPAPDFERTTLSGDRVRRDDWTGRVVILNFWATWCAPCREEIPRLIDLQNEYSPDDVRVVGVSIDEEGESAVRPYAEKMDISYPILLDPDRSLAEAYDGHYAVPTTFVIDPEGRIRQRYMRVVTEEDLRPVIEALLATR